MTAQFSERLIYRRENLSLCENPLKHFLESSASTFEFVFTSTACWRGYIGTWAIENDRLYLVSLSGRARTSAGGDVKDVTLVDLFPGYPDGVYAHWFNGELRCPQGELLKYVHGGYASTYEKDLFLDVRRGVLVGERLVDNGSPKSNYYEGRSLNALTAHDEEGGL
jgi:hypothetical protein